MNLFVFFDFDGVIIDSHEVQRKALETVYRDCYGEREVPYEDFFQKSGDSLENIFSALQIPVEKVTLYREYSANHLEDIIFYEQFLDIFEYITDNGAKCVLCTGKERKRTLQTMKYFDIEKYFSDVVCSDDVKNPKPASDSIVKIQDKYQISSDRILYVGDGVNDIKCAKNANVECVAITWGDLTRELLEKEQPDSLIDTIDDLYSYIKNWVEKKKK